MTKIKNSIKGNKKFKKPTLKLLASPNHVCFKNYEEGQVYKEIIKISNQDVKSFHISIKFDNPEELKLSTLSDNHQKILEVGDDILLEIEFRPILSYNKESVDRRYEISINVHNSNTKLLIPVVILSPNSSINFPREIQLPDTAIDTPAYTNICVLNYSNLPYKFSIDTKSEIKIIPECKVIAMKSGDGITFLVEFIPRTLSDFREKIYICFENDKRMSILLKCNVLPVNVSFIEDSIEFLPTLIGMRDMKSIQVVNNGDTATLFEWMPIQNHCANENNEEHPSLKFLEIYPMNGELPPQTITKIDLIFKPYDTNDDEDDFEIQKELIITLALKLSICHNYNPSIIVKGKVVGPSFQLDHNIININEIFVGETRSIDVNLKNVGDISGKVFFHKIQSVNDGIIKASSKIEILKAGEVRKFRIQFLARKIGKFIDQGIFKVKNGAKLTLSIQGIIKPLNIIAVPSSIEFPSSAICIPQMKFLKITNEHPFNVDIRLEIENNGHDDPLEFLEFYKSYSTSSDSISKSSSLESMNNNHHKIATESCSSLLTRTSIKNFMERSGEMEQLRDTLTTTRDEIVEIFNKVDEYLERKEIVNSMLFDDKLCNEVEKREIVQTVVEMLIENLIESNELKFYEKNWQLPEHPRQIECNKNFIKIQSKSSEEVKVFVVPNYIGKFTRNLKLFIVMSDLSNQLSIDETIVNIPIVIDCQTPDIKIHNQTNEITGYAESEITLDILVENLSTINGFFTFSKLFDAQMEVKCTEEKFHINGKSKKILNLIIVPLISGKIIKYVNIIALGSNKKYPITIECKSLPPDIVINPKKIFVNDLEVLNKDDTRIFIENRSTTKARFFIKLEHDNQCFTINPRGGILSSKQCTVVMLEKFFHDPGDYHDILIVEIVNSKVIKIPIRCTVKKLPITIEPSFCNIIDFGTLFTSKNSYYLDYKFTNCGKISYMIFIILKNWKNRNEIRYTIEPNRFELSPNCSRMVKFSLNALDALSCIEEFTIEGCSIHFPIRELIWESKLKANVIKPTINFSSNELIFNCFYGQEDDLMDSFEITNESSLPLTVALKIEGKFNIYVTELNSLEQKIRFDLKVKESRKIFINFNSNHLKNYSSSRTFEGTIKAYSLGKFQSTLKLIAHLIYPEIELSTNDVNIIANPKQSCTSNFIISNPSDTLTASFELKFKDNSTIITSIHEKRQENLLNTEQCLMKQKRNLRGKFLQKNLNHYKIFYDGDNLEISDVTNDSEGEENDENSQNSDSLKTVEVKADEIIQFYNSLTKETPEVKFNEEPEVEQQTTSKDEQDECYVLLSEMKGILKPNESRLISIQFSGSNKAFHLSSFIGCQVVGGSCYDIHIKITNCNPNVLITKTYFEIRKSWQEISINNLCISNINPLKNVIKVIKPNNEDMKAEFIEGYVKLGTRTPTEFILDEDKNIFRELKFLIFPGCMPIFESKFGIQINDKTPIPISFYSKNSMPMATLLDINRNSLYDMNKSFEYDCLREMFKYVDHISVQEEVINFEDVTSAKLKFQELQQEKKVRKKSIKKHKTNTKQYTMQPKSIDSLSAGDSCDLMSKEFRLFYNENGKTLMCEKPHRMFSGKMLQIVDEEIENGNFLALDYPNEYPQSHEIISFIGQYGFAKSLEADEIFGAYKSIYDRYVMEKFRHSKKSSGCKEQCCDNSIVVPLPLVLVEYSLDVGDVKIGDVYEKIIKLYIHSDFTSVAIRTEAVISDLTVEFLPYPEFFKVNNYEKESNIEKYINRLERQHQLSEHPYSVRRCHSFDFIEGKVHSRIISKGKLDFDQINQTYNEKMSPKVKFDDRSPYTLTEIFQKAEFNEKSSRVIEFKIIFSPKIDSYEEVKMFDEILYIDLHLGPQIPLHVTANIIQSDPDQKLLFE